MKQQSVAIRLQKEHKKYQKLANKDSEQHKDQWHVPQQDQKRLKT